MDELEAISLMGWFSGGIHPHLTRIFNPTRFCDAPDSEEATRTLAKKAPEENFAAANERPAGREFFYDHCTAPDAHFFWCTRRATSLISRWIAMRTSLRTTIACINATA
jgi:glutathione S-transferase